MSEVIKKDDFIESVVNVTVSSSTTEEKIVCVPSEESMSNCWYLRNLNVDEQTYNTAYVDTYILVSDCNTGKDAAFGNGILAIPYDGTHIIISNDGEKYKEIELYFDEKDFELTSISYKNGIWCASGGSYMSSGENYLFYNNFDIDSIWYRANDISFSTTPRVKACNNYFIAFNSSGEFAKSINGIHWEKDDVSFDIENVTYFNNYLYAVGKNGIYRTILQNGTPVWSKVSDTSTIDIVANGTTEIIGFIPNSQDIISSSNGENWTTQRGVLSNNIIDNPLFTACAVNGVIYKPNGYMGYNIKRNGNWYSSSIESANGQFIYCNWK